MESDLIEWKKAQRRGREKGCYVYIPRNALALSLVATSSKESSESHPRPITEVPLLYKIVPWGKNRVIVAFRTEEEV